MKTLRYHTTRFITLLVAIQLLNLSVYAQDFMPVNGETGSVETNITETLAEYVVEVVLGHKNAIPEQSRHHKDLHFHKHIFFKAISISSAYSLSEPLQHNLVTTVTLQESYNYLYLQEINPPPPKA